MSNLTINLDFSGDGDGGKKSTEKNRHSRFPRKRNLTQNDQQMKHKHDHKYQGPPPWRNGAKHPSLPSATHNKSSSHIPSPAHARSSAPKPGSSSSSTSLTITVKNTTNSEQSKTSTSTYNHTASLPGTPAPFCNPLKYLAIDCEMVGTGPKGRNSELARCSIVSYDGDVVYDKYIKPANPVTDYRTRWSGISWKQLVNATLYTQARKEILKILQGKVVIGHAIHNDFKSMSYSHPAVLTRDTSRIPLLNQKAGFGGKECASLKRLTKALLNRDIQTGKKGHSSVEDAKATMELYKVVEVEWERTLASRTY